MPLIDAGFRTGAGLADHRTLVTVGPSLQVTVMHLPVDDGPSGPSETVHALIDTGAWHSCIDAGLAQKLELPVVDTQAISGVNGVAEHPVYLARIDVPQLAGFQYGRFAGVKLTEGGQPHAVLLGRTFLQGIIMIYDGLRAQVTLAAPLAPAS